MDGMDSIHSPLPPLCPLHVRNDEAIGEGSVTGRKNGLIAQTESSDRKNGLKAQKHIAQGNALGFFDVIAIQRPERAKASYQQEISLLLFQGVPFNRSLIRTPTLPEAALINFVSFVKSSFAALCIFQYCKSTLFLRVFVFKNKKLCASVPLCLQNIPVAIWFIGHRRYLHWLSQVSALTNEGICDG